jgi:hypothetical protein
MEKLNVETNLKKTAKLESLSVESPKIPASLETDCSRKIKPRAIIFRSTNKDFDTIRKLIETQFSEVEIVYITTGPAASVLRITKSMPLKLQDSPMDPFYTIEY